ncbi:MAG TPA: TIGR02206 family membrane protein [Candidatus Eisenbacteria bacterium]|nr:TIGR02206 family membrane protein [Candidatus Eisenbacteria bacterium]
MRPFELFGPDHLLVLLAIAVVTLSLTLLVRKNPWGIVSVAARVGLALYLLLVGGLVFVMAARSGLFRLIELLPFHLCDMAIILAVVALLWRIPWVYEVLYFWALAGTLLAIFTPDVPMGFPDPAFLSFFGIHAGVVASACVLTWGEGMRPRPGAAWTVFGITNAYAGLVGIVNFIAGTNFMYLNRKPSSPTLLDMLGPWPWYLLVADALALGLFLLLELPFRRRAAPVMPDRVE